MSKGTFNYSPHNVAGGKTRKPISLGPHRGKFVTQPDGKVVWVSATAPPLKAPKPPNTEGHYVTRETGSMSITDWKQRLRPRQIKPTVPEETLEEWCKRHPVLGVTTAECHCGRAFYGPDALADATAHMKEHNSERVVYA